MSQLTGDLNKDWNLLLSKINNFTTRMILSSIAKPVEITPDKLKIKINNEQFIKQAQEVADSPAIQEILVEIFDKLPEVEIV